MCWNDVCFDLSTIPVTSNFERKALKDRKVEISIQKGKYVQGRLRGEDNGFEALQIIACSENTVTGGGPKEHGVEVNSWLLHTRV